MSAAPSVRVREVLLYERPVRLRMPFRFGVVTLDRGVQAFVRARVSLGDGREAWGVAAEMLAPKWFDKDLTLTDEENEEQLRDALRLARALYLAEPARSAFALYAATYPDLYRQQDGVVRLRIREGQLAIASLRCAGFAVGADLAVDRMRAITP